MPRDFQVLAAVGSLSLALAVADTAFAETAGGILKVGWFDSPASMSIREESTIAAERPMMGVFNNLVMYDQHVAQNSPRSIVPELATAWAWNEEGTELTLPLRQGVKWHDGKRFTAEPVSVDYAMRQNDGAWQISDVYLDGTISQLATQRSEFGAILRREGFEGLIASMQRKVKLLAGNVASTS